MQDWGAPSKVHETVEEGDHTPSRRHRPRDVYFILHIPKCAGRTVQNFLVSNFGNRATDPPADVRSEQRLGERILFPARRKAPFRFFGKRYKSLAAVALDDVDFVFGFYVSRSMKAFFADRNVKQAVLIRDPVSHIFSHYNFRMRKYTDQGMKPFSFDLWYKSRRPNPISKYLFAYLEVPSIQHIFMSDQSKLALIVDGLADFWHVGAHDACGELIARIASEQGVPPTFEKRNVTPKRFIDFAEFEERYGHKIRKENSLDQAIFDYFTSDVALQKRPQPEVGGQEWRNILRGGFVPWYILRYRLKRRFNI